MPGVIQLRRGNTDSTLLNNMPCHLPSNHCLVVTQDFHNVASHCIFTILTGFQDCVCTGFSSWNVFLIHSPLPSPIKRKSLSFWAQFKNYLLLRCFQISLVDKVEKAMAPHSSTLAWKIPWTEEPGRLQSMGLLESDTTERLHFHFSLSCIGEGNGNPLQCSCLENPRDRGSWWAAVYGVAQIWT